MSFFFFFFFFFVVVVVVVETNICSLLLAMYFGNIGEQKKKKAPKLEKLNNILWLNFSLFNVLLTLLHI